MTLPQTILQDIKKSLEYVYWDVKIYWISPETLWNSTTLFMLVSINVKYLGIFEHFWALQNILEHPQIQIDLTGSSVMTVVEFHSEADEIQ